MSDEDLTLSVQERYAPRSICFGCGPANARGLHIRSVPDGDGLVARARLVAERLHKLGNTLKAANNHYNDTVRGLAGQQGLYGKIERFQQLSTRANKEMTALEPIHADIENDRLDAVGTPDNGDESPARQAEQPSPPAKLKPIN